MEGELFMKKVVSLIIALMLCLSMCVSLADVSLPLFEEPVTIRIFSNKNSPIIYEDNDIFEDFQKETGVNLEIEVVDASDFDEQLNLLIAGGVLPDAIMGAASFTTGQLLKYNASGTFIDLADLIAEYAPNLSARMEANSAIADAITLPNGQIASLPYFQMHAENGECPNLMHYINIVWLDKLGLESPTTLDEFYDVLVAFRDGDPNGNGKADEVALTFNNLDGLRKMSTICGTMLGGQNDYNLFLEDGVVSYVPLTQEYKDYVTFLRKCYEEGIMEPDCFTMSGSQISAKAQDTDAVYGSFLLNASFSLVGYDRMFDYDVVAPFEHNGKYYVDGRVYANPGQLVITSACEHPEYVMKWANLFYDEEYGKIVWMGHEGVSYQYNEDGSWNWIYTEENPDTGSVRESQTFQGYRWLWNCPDDWFKLNDATEKPVNEQRSYYAMNFPGACRLPMPTLYYTDEAAKEMAILSADLNNYETKMFVSFITGDASIDDDWDAFCNELINMGAEKLVALGQNAYDNR